MTDSKLLTDFPKVVQLSEKIVSLDERINYLLTIKRDAQLAIQQASQSWEVFCGSKIKPALLNLPHSIDIEVERLERLRTVRSSTDDSKKENEVVVIKEVTSQAEPTVKGNEIFDVTSAAEYLGVSVSYIYKLTHNNLIPFSKPTGKKVFIDKADLDKFIKDHKTNAKSDIEKETLKYLTRKRN